MLINVTGAKVTLEDSSFKADRQGIIARTGTWTLKNVTAETTGKFLTVDSNKTNNANYLTNNGWSSGNEVPCASIVVGDTNANSYNDDVTFTISGGLTTKIANDASTIVVRSDGTYKTTVNVDAAFCVKSNHVSSWDVDTSSTTTKMNVSNLDASSIATLNKKTASDTKNLYSITGVVKKVTNTNYGNLIVEDTTSGEEFSIYGSYSTATFTCTDDGVFSLSNKADLLTSDVVGKVYNFIGTFEYYSNTAEIKNALAYKIHDSFSTCTVSISVNDYSLGTASLSKTSDIAYGEEITVTATPVSGYKIGSVEVIDGAGNKEDITSTLKSKSTVKNTVVVTFVSDSYFETVHSIVFNSTNNQKSVSSYSNSWSNITDGVTYNIVNFNNNNNGWDVIKCGSKNAASVASISTAIAFTDVISKTSITIDSITAASVNSIKVITSTDKNFTNVVEKIELNKVKGEQETELTKPQANLFIKYVFDCAKGSSNGLIQVSSVTFTSTNTSSNN